jgi:hypothetical protein
VQTHVEIDFRLSNPYVRLHKNMRWASQPCLKWKISIRKSCFGASGL